MEKFVVVNIDGEGIEFIGSRHECVEYIANEMRKDIDEAIDLEEYEEGVADLRSGKINECLWYVILTPEEALECGR